MNVEQLEVMAEHYKMLSDKSRLTILACLKEREMCVCDLVEILQSTQPNVSQHLRKLKAAGLVTETRKGQWVYYALNVSDKPYLEETLNYLPSFKEKVLQVKGIC